MYSVHIVPCKLPNLLSETCKKVINQKVKQNKIKNKIPNSKKRITMNRTYPKWQDEQTDWDAGQTDKDVHMGTCDKERYSYWPSYVPFSTSFAYFETKF